MDVSLLLDLADSVARKREIENQLLFATLDSDQAELKQELRNLNRRIRKFSEGITGTYPEPFIDCRDTGHQWQKVSVEFDSDDQMLRTLQCARCEAFRYDIINAFGEVRSRRYHYSDGFILEAAGTNHPRAFWRGVVYMQARQNNT